MPVREAGNGDVERMLDLAASKRAQYEEYSPLFWRPSTEGRDAQRTYFQGLVAGADAICLVNETDRVIDAFLIATIVSAPPVYDPGGKVCVIDDFVVADPATWTTTGSALRDEAERRAAAAGAVLSVTVCGRRDEAKRDALLRSGSHVASEWHVRSIKP